MDDFEAALMEFLRLAHTGDLDKELTMAATTPSIPIQWRGVYVGYNWSDDFIPVLPMSLRCDKYHSLILSQPNMSWTVRADYFLVNNGPPYIAELLSSDMSEAEEEEILSWLHSQIDAVGTTGYIEGVSAVL